ncbi:MAG TPA: hypothetical protein VKY31_02195 [Terriglobia bacterium]|nr:hypothetical protein [Terriglobia bacterium]
MQTEGLKILLALEPRWIASFNGLEFLPLKSSDISVEGSTIRVGPYARSIRDLEWLRSDTVRIRTTSRLRSQIDTITLYPGDHLPSTAGVRRRRRAFQIEIGDALRRYFGVRQIRRQMLYSDRLHGIGGAYPRFLIGRHAAIAVDPDEDSPVVNALMRSALLWTSMAPYPVTAVVPSGRHQCIAARLRAMPKAWQMVDWLQWDGTNVHPLQDCGESPETYIQPFEAYHARQTRTADDPPAAAHQERRLESNLIGQISKVLPNIDVRHVYPQVPSFAGEERNIIDLLTITTEGRLVVIEIKAGPDPELPFQALDYWIAVERHRKSGDFTRNGYFAGCLVNDLPALLVLVAPLLAYHKTSRQLTHLLPHDLPIMEIGINQTWQKGIKILRRQGIVS